MDLRLAWRMVRPGFLTVTLVACLLGQGSALAAGAGWHGATALATILLAALVHASGNVFNDYHDGLSGADAANQQGLYPFTGGTRLIQTGQVSLQQTARLAWLLLLIGLVAGLALAWRVGPGLLLLGAAGLFSVWAYSAPPLRLMTRALGELCVAIVWTLVVVGADYVQRGHYAAQPLLLALGYAALVANLLLVNGIPDAASDAQTGKATLVVRLGAQAAARLYVAVALLAHGWLLLLLWWQCVPVAASWGLLSLPVSLLAAFFVWRRAGQPERLCPAIVLSIGAAVMHGLAMAMGLWLAAPG